MDHNPYQPPPQQADRTSDWRVLVIPSVLFVTLVGGTALAGAIAFVVAVITVMITQAMGFRDQLSATMFGFAIGGVLGFVVLIVAMVLAVRLLYKHYDLGNDRS